MATEYHPRLSTQATLVGGRNILPTAKSIGIPISCCCVIFFDMPYLVREHLFIGDISDAANVLQHGSDEITHVLSVLSSTSISFFSEWRKDVVIPIQEIRKVYVEDDAGHGSRTSLAPGKVLYSLENAGKDLKFVRMAIPLRDTESENLLDYLDVCLDFIEQSRKEGSILVHCFAGVSRSAAIVTAYLMRGEKLSQEDALESLRQSRDTVCPNDGFLDQLKMFEEMDFKVDYASHIYRRFRLKGLDPGLSAAKVDSEVEAPSEKEAIGSPLYRCKKCRRVVALQENVVDHLPGEGETSFEWHKRRSGNPFNKPNDECSSIFVEPLSWMTTVEEGGLEGKLLCAKCEGRLGYFNWAGIQCSCGSWITPAFQLHKSRVDISTV